MMLGTLSLTLVVIGLLGLGYAALVAAIIFYPLSLIVGLIALAFLVKRKRRALWAYGTARWASFQELYGAGLIGTTGGILIGRLHPSLAPTPAAMLPAILHRPGRRAGEASRLFFEALRRRMHSAGPLVRLQRAVHVAVFGPVGSGKSTGYAIPWLLSSPEAAVVLDYKAELAKITALHRHRRFGHRIVRLDPFGVLTKDSDQFNPIDFIDRDSPEALDEVRDLSVALVPRTGAEKEPHWLDSAEGWIAAMGMAVVSHAPADDRSLQTVRQLLTNPDDMKAAIQLLCASNKWDGIVARLGYQLTQFQDKELASTLTTTNRFLRFLDTPAIAKNTVTSTFDPAELNGGKMTIYCILPPEHMRAQAALLRMWITSFLRAVVRAGLSDTRRVNFLLDEAASLQHLDAVDDALDKYRGYGVRLHCLYQSMGQLPLCFPEGRDQTFLANTSQIYFAVNEPKTAEFLSQRLGEETILVDSTQRNRSRSYSAGCGSGQQGTQYSDSHSISYSQQARKLLKPEEIIGLPANVALTFTPGTPPICTTLVRYFEEPGLWQPSRARRARSALGVLCSAVLFCAMGLGAAGMMTLLHQERPSWTRPAVWQPRYRFYSPQHPFFRR